MKLYGIKSCDSCRKARKWLDAQGLDATWVDLREEGVSGTDIERWLAAVGPDVLVNRRSTTWRGLDEADRPPMEAAAVLPVLLRHPTLIKRPVFERDGDVRVGFTSAVQDWLAAR